MHTTATRGCLASMSLVRKKQQAPAIHSQCKGKKNPYPHHNNKLYQTGRQAPSVVTNNVIQTWCILLLSTVVKAGKTSQYHYRGSTALCSVLFLLPARQIRKRRRPLNATKISAVATCTPRSGWLEGRPQTSTTHDTCNGNTTSLQATAT